MLHMLAQSNSSTGGGFLAMVLLLVELVIFVAVVVGLWKVYTKAGQPGWAAIIPIYNVYILLKIVGRPWWWLVLMFIPLINIIVGVVVLLDLAKCFGKSVLYAIGMILLGFIFIPLLGFGDAQYRGPAGAAA